MPGVARENDIGSHGGPIKSITPSVKVNGRSVLTIGAIYLCEKHGVQHVIQGSSSHLVEGKPVSRLGDLCSCQATIVSASSNVIDGG